VYDNGSPEDSRSVAETFRGRLPLKYTLNEPGHGLGYSLSRGATECTGQRVIELNDDALVPPNFLTRLDEVFACDPNIGVVGVRAIEEKYAQNGDGIGLIDEKTCDVIGNFDQPANDVIDVDHVYGFCYAYKRELLDRGGRHDRVLLAKDYSSGNRLETDHCLTAKRLGFRVVYDGTLAVRHLAKPRGDISERSLKWKLNHTRNTLYLYLKHYGLFGRRCLALRFAFLKDVGVLSALGRPNRSNWKYFLTGLRGRTSAFAHYLRYLIAS
jgi:GT2 family glycosyltransferase